MGLVQIMSDDRMSWPVIVRSGQTRSLEDHLLSNADLLGPGLAYFEPDPGAVLFDSALPERILIRFVSSDPVTLERSVRWLSVSLEGSVLGASPTPGSATPAAP
jgi:hypothetical protein